LSSFIFISPSFIHLFHVVKRKDVKRNHHTLPYLLVLARSACNYVGREDLCKEEAQSIR
jgi:hypothetical protein